MTTPLAIKNSPYKKGTHMEIVLMRTQCGFCAFGNRHDLCPSGVYSNHKVHICACDCERANQIKCLECGNRTQDELNPQTWHCVDLDACRLEIQRQIDNNPTIQQIRELREKSRERVAETRQSQKRATGRPTSGSCIHCGEPTKGGKFLPGHDATWVSEQVAHVGAGTKGDTKRYDELMARCDELGVSDALKQKIQKRIVLT